MLDSEALKTRILNALRQLTEGFPSGVAIPALTVHSTIALEISSEILEKVELVGVYAGTIPGTPPTPDPLAGQYTTGLALVPITGAALFAASTGWLPWVTTIFSLIRLSMTQPSASTITIVPIPALSVMPPPVIDLQNLDSFEEVYGRLSEAITSCVNGAVVSGLTSAATSPLGGIGTLTLLALQ